VDGGDGLHIWRVSVKILVFIPCYVGPCHHSMARPQVVDGGDGLHIWKIAVIISNKQSRTADKGW
jgi:hypothetical protein